MDINNIEFDALDNVDLKDCPDFVDAYVSKAHWKDTELSLTEDELDKLNEDFTGEVQSAAFKQAFGI